MMEALVGPLRATDVGLAERILEFFELFPNVELRAADALVARQAASLRARLGLAGADALILATGLVAGCGRIVTNDREWSTKLSQLRWSGATASVVLLDDHLPFPE